MDYFLCLSALSFSVAAVCVGLPCVSLSAVLHISQQNLSKNHNGPCSLIITQFTFMSSFVNLSSGDFVFLFNFVHSFILLYARRQHNYFLNYTLGGSTVVPLVRLCSLIIH